VKHLIRQSIFVILILALAYGCGHSVPETKKESPEEIYNKAVAKLERKKFLGVIPYRNTEKAIELFQMIIDNYPNSKYAVLSELGLADAYFYRDEYDEAQSRYSEFYNLHPGNEYTPYAIYMSGRCFEELSSSYDRDLTPVQNAIAEFTKIVRLYPDSKYYEDAQKRLNLLNEKIIKREFYIGRFYYRRKLYHSAIDRLEGLIRNYSNFENREQTLYYLYMSFYNIGDMDGTSKYYKKLLDEFPNTKYRDKHIEESITYNIPASKH